MDYSTIHPEIWTGETGAKLHGDPAAQVVYAYLMTCRHRNQLGLYYLPISYIAEDTGISHDVVTEKLSKLSGPDIGFCKYDHARRVIWVIKMAPRQISRSPKAILGGAAALAKLPDHPFKRELVALYGADLSKLHTVSIGYPEEPNTVSIPDAPIAPIQSINNSEQSKITDSARARPDPVDRVVEPGFSARRMQAVFVAEYEAVLRDSPSLGGKNLGDFHARVMRSAELQGKNPETMFLDAVRAWLAKPRTEVELRAPYACFAQAWGGLAAPETSKASEGSASTVEGLREAARAALANGDMAELKRLNAQRRELEDAADRGVRRAR